jgi:hypothetical protein
MTWAASGPRWAAYRPQKPSSDGISWRDVSEAVNQPVSVPAGQSDVGADSTMRPQQDSNLRTRLRRPMLYPLSYGGLAPEKATSRRPYLGTFAGRGAETC